MSYFPLSFLKLNNSIIQKRIQSENNEILRTLEKLCSTVHSLKLPQSQSAQKLVSNHISSCSIDSLVDCPKQAARVKCRQKHEPDMKQVGGRIKNSKQKINHRPGGLYSRDQIDDESDPASVEFDRIIASHIPVDSGLNHLLNGGVESTRQSSEFNDDSSSVSTSSNNINNSDNKSTFEIPIRIETRHLNASRAKSHNHLVENCGAWILDKRCGVGKSTKLKYPNCSNPCCSNHPSNRFASDMVYIGDKKHSTPIRTSQQQPSRRPPDRHNQRAVSNGNRQQVQLVKLQLNPNHAVSTSSSNGPTNLNLGNENCLKLLDEFLKEFDG